MNQFDIQIDGIQPKVNQFTQTIGQSFSIMVDYKNWTANKAFLAMELFDQDGVKVTEKMIALSETQILHICSPIQKDTKLQLKTKSQTQVPSDVVQLVAAAPSQKCNNYSYMSNVMSPTATDVKVTGPIEVDLNTLYAAYNQMDVKLGRGTTKPELKVTDTNGSTIFGVQGFVEMNLGDVTLYNNGRQIHMNADKLTLNGVQLALKEVTIGDTTLSVLAAV